jgi:hypothetical protein
MGPKQIGDTAIRAEVCPTRVRSEHRLVRACRCDLGAECFGTTLSRSIGPTRERSEGSVHQFTHVGSRSRAAGDGLVRPGRFEAQVRVVWSKSDAFIESYLNWG